MTNCGECEDCSCEEESIFPQEVLEEVKEDLIKFYGKNINCVNSIFMHNLKYDDALVETILLYCDEVCKDYKPKEKWWKKLLKS